MATIETAWRDLTAALEGEVVLPGSPRYDEVRRPQIRASTTCARRPWCCAGLPTTWSRRSRSRVARVSRSRYGAEGTTSPGARPAPGWCWTSRRCVPWRSRTAWPPWGPASGSATSTPPWPNTTSRSRPAAAPRSGSAARSSAAGLACWAAAGGSRRTRWSRQRWCWPTGGWWSATSSATRTCSGRCAARAPGASAWSRASRSARCPIPRPPRSTSGGPTSARRR